MKACLLITHNIPSDIRGRIAAGEAQRMEYLELASKLDAELLDYRAVAGSPSIVVRLGGRLSKPAGLALLGWLRRRDVDVFYVGSEMTGLFLGMLLRFQKRRPRLVIVNHYLSNPRKAFVFRLARLHSAVDGFINLNEYQARFLETPLGLSAEKVHRVLYGANVDGSYFRNDLAAGGSGKFILSVGRESRDYETLFSALRPDDIPATIVSSGIRDPDEYRDVVVPHHLAMRNVRVLGNIPFAELRDLYAGAAFVVLPMQDVEYPAGITAIMEAMAMGKTVVASYSRGLGEFIRDGITGLWTKSGDAMDMREKILYLWNNPDIAHRMGREAEKSVRERVDLTRYVNEIAAIIDNVTARNNAK